MNFNTDSIPIGMESVIDIFLFKLNKNIIFVFMEPGKVYHVFNRGNNREPIFYSRRNYFYFLDLFYKYLEDYLEVIAYCLMPNHFHFMIRVKIIKDVPGRLVSSEPNISRQLSERFRRFFIAYAQAINKQEKRTGSLFQKKFKRIEVKKDDYFSDLIAYIHLNPVKAGLCANCSEWNFSSYNTLVNYWETKIMRLEVLNWFGGRKQFILFHQSVRHKRPESNQNYLLDK